VILDFNCIDTTPGATGCHAFLAPPANFAGGSWEYMAWLKDQWFDDLGFRQYLLSAAIFHKAGTRQSTSKIIGPFADGLVRVLAKLREGKMPERAPRLDLAS